MAGITGHINLNKVVSISIIQKMSEAIRHRSNYGESIFISQNEHVGLGNIGQSFAVSAIGEKDSTNYGTSLVISLDGEIYNSAALKTILSLDFKLKSNTDSEIILAGYRKWGEGVLQYLKGAFAFVIFDEQDQKVFMARDRFGMKPLYFAIQDHQLFFGSELKAILATGQVEKEIDFSAFADYFVYRYIPSPKTIWKHINKLSPAHYAIIDTNSLEIEITAYWDLDTANHVDEKAVDRVHDLIKNAVKEHTSGEASVGSFLSGGYDSSALVLYMKHLKQQPKTFSIGFAGWEKSEDQFAKVVAEHLGVENETLLADKKSLELISLMPQVYDEPIADISILPTYMVSRKASQSLESVLSGEGADELFGGYAWQHDFYNKSYPESFLAKLKQRVKAQSLIDFYAQAMSMGWFDRDELKKMLHPNLHSYIPQDVHWFYRLHFKDKWSPLKSIQYMDVKCFMGELVLTKVDRGSMANSLQVKMPFLDHELFEYVFQLDEKTYFKKNQTKYLLYQNLKNHLPEKILNRKKQGFVGPDSYYMDLEWYKAQLKNSQMVTLGLVNQEYIDELLTETYNWKLWKLVIMEKWIKEWM